VLKLQEAEQQIITAYVVHEKRLSDHRSLNPRIATHRPVITDLPRHAVLAAEIWALPWKHAARGMLEHAGPPCQCGDARV